MKNEFNTVCERLQKLPVAVLADVLYEMGYAHQALCSAIRPLSNCMKVAGPAFCIKGLSSPSVDLPAGGPDPAYELFRHMYPGCVAVIDTGGYNPASIIGENAGIAAKVRGCTGYVVDGAIRDSQELIAMEKFAVFARAISPIAMKGRWRYVGFEIPIAMAGLTCRSVTVNPGDFVVGDADGVLIIPRAVGAEAAEAAEEVVRREERIREELLRGVDREEAYRRHELFAHIGQPQQ
ncbi:MAG: RraA family protein [Bacillota bacterium]|nr:RraA family protein [Bacillota bacterium]